jgi:hypothetical protein
VRRVGEHLVMTSDARRALPAAVAHRPLSTALSDRRGGDT